MTSKKKKPRKFVNERKLRKKTAKPKPVEKPKTVKERIIEEHQKGTTIPQIAQILNVRVNYVTKFLYLHKPVESVIIKALVEANEQANKSIQTIADTLQEKPTEPKTVPKPEKQTYGESILKEGLGAVTDLRKCIKDTKPAEPLPKLNVETAKASLKEVIKRLEEKEGEDDCIQSK